MKHKQPVTLKLEQLENMITGLSSQISSARSPRELKETIDQIKERIADLQTLINNESDSWN